MYTGWTNSAKKQKQMLGVLFMAKLKLFQNIQGRSMHFLQTKHAIFKCLLFHFLIDLLLPNYPKQGCWDLYRVIPDLWQFLNEIRVYIIVSQTFLSCGTVYKISLVVWHLFLYKIKQLAKTSSLCKLNKTNTF